MNRRLTIALAFALGLVTFAASKPSKHGLNPVNAGIPIPLCNPTDPTCPYGGPR
jgi:hypothetical protein